MVSDFFGGSQYTPGLYSGNNYAMSFIYGSGGSNGGAYTFTGNSASSMFNYFANGGVNFPVFEDFPIIKQLINIKYLLIV